jgi:hypothetical protein
MVLEYRTGLAHLCERVHGQRLLIRRRRAQPRAVQAAEPRRAALDTDARLRCTRRVGVGHGGEDELAVQRGGGVVEHVGRAAWWDTRPWRTETNTRDTRHESSHGRVSNASARCGRVSNCKTCVGVGAAAVDDHVRVGVYERRQRRLVDAPHRRGGYALHVLQCARPLRPVVRSRRRADPRARQYKSEYYALGSDAVS